MKLDDEAWARMDLSAGLAIQREILEALTKSRRGLFPSQVVKKLEDWGGMAVRENIRLLLQADRILLCDDRRLQARPEKPSLSGAGID